MTEELGTATDTELIVLVRAGDAAAYEELFLRHRDVALRYARRIADSARADDLCSEAFAKIFDLLQRGKGPDVAFRAYLLTTVRTSHLNTIRSHGREDLVPDHEPLARMVPVIEDPDARFDRTAICRAFQQLPERWQATLWLTTVEGYSHDQVSAHLGINANAVASLAFRARAGLRDAYLAQHLLEITDPRCRDIVEHLPSYLRDRLAGRRRQVISDHLDTCPRCAAAALELSQVEMSLGALLAPLALAGFTISGAASVGATGGTVAALLTPFKAVGAKLVGLGPQAAAGVAAAGLAAGLGATALHQASSPPRPAVEAAPAKALDRAPTATRPLPASGARPDAAVTAVPTPGTASGRPVLARPDPGAPGAAPAPELPDELPVKPSSPAFLSTSPVPPEDPPRLGPLVVHSRGTLLGRWEQVDVPVLSPARGAVLVITTDHTVQARPPATAGTGWTCERPSLRWLDGDLLATTRTVCTATGEGTAMPRFAFQVAPRAHLTAVLTGPPAVPGPTSARTTLLRTNLL